MEFFTYPKLEADSVRLLKIHSPSTTDNTRFEMIHVLDSDLDNIKYEAVSYVWGSPERQNIITFVNGSRLKITTTLDQALPHLITASTTGMLWIDQLCINQDNNEEKSRQVPKMGLIYTHAERTLAWLGAVPAADTHFSRIVSTIHPTLDNWIKIHGEDPLLECPVDTTSHVSDFELLRRVIHNRRTLKKSNWRGMLDALRRLGFQSKTGNWSMGTRSEMVGDYLWREPLTNVSKEEDLIFTDEIGTDLNLDHKAKQPDPEELEILKREDSLLFYCYRAILSMSTSLSKGNTKDLAASFKTVIKSLRSLLQHTLGNPWCTRVWIMQEVRLSRNVELLINDEILKPQNFLRADDLLSFCCYVLGNVSSEDKTLHRAKWTSLFDGSPDRRDPLSTYLIRRIQGPGGSAEEASDPRDLIYGLLPVCKPEPHLPATNYDLDVSQVFTAATRYFVARHDSLWVLQFCIRHRSSQTPAHEKSGPMNLPSWVPDWSGPPAMEPLSTSYYPNIFRGVPRCETHNEGRLYTCALCGDGGISYSAAGLRKHVAIEENSEEVLTIQGKVIDQVIDLVLEPDDIVWEHHLNGIFFSTGSDNSILSQMDEVFAEIIGRTARFEDVATPLGRRDLLEFLLISPYLYQAFAFRIDELSMEDVLDHAEQKDAEHMKFFLPKRLKRYFSVLFGRNFALTDSGFYFGPDTMQIGDKIAIIHGSEFPLVLRPMNNDEQTYTLIGQCMVRDRKIMFGGAVDWEEADAQIFRLV